MAQLRSTLLLVALLGPACSEDPRYVQPGLALEVNADGTTDMGSAAASVTLPLRLESDREIEERAELAEELGISPDQIPFATLKHLDVSVEWTIRNLEDRSGVARIHLNGANEWFAYEPGAFVVDPEEEEEPPPLAGDVPISVAAGQTVSGVFREDQIAEASIDLELITRGGLNPFAAMLEVHEDTAELNDAASGAAIPRRAFASLVRFDLIFLADRHMVMELAVRVRDHRRPPLLHDECLDLAADPPPEACASELTTFSPAGYQPPMTAP